MVYGPVKKGFTLIEIMVVLVVVGIMVAVSVPIFSGLFELSLKSTSNTLAAKMRYLYNKSVTERLVLRIVYDLDEHSYWVESTEGEYVIASLEEEERKEEEKDKDEGEDEAKEGEFMKEEEFLLEPQKLKDGVFFKDIYASYRDGPVTGGKIYTYFFPNGFATATVINFRDEEDKEHYSLKLFPLTGKVDIENAYREAETSD